MGETINNYKIINPKSIAKDLNALTFTDYFYRLCLLAQSVFKWNNLPNGIDEKWIERYLFTEGSCVFFRDDTNGFMVAKGVTAGRLNYYDEPTKIRPTANNYLKDKIYKNYQGKDIQANEFNYSDCVVIRNNDLMLPTAPTIQLYSMRLSDISRTIDVNVHAQKTPLIIKCSNRQLMTLKQVFKQWTGNEPVIFGDKDLETNEIKVLKTDAPIVFDKLQQQKHTVWNEVMTFLGVNNANMDKRERLVDDEVQANNEQIELSAQVMLKARQRACELINKLYGLNISVELRDLSNEATEAENKDIDLSMYRQ